MNEHVRDEHLSVGEIGLLIVTTATRNLALTGRRATELRRRQAQRTRRVHETATPGSH